MRVPETRYARSGELAIAYQVHGDGPHDLLFSGTTASNVETVWAMPEAHRLFERLGRFARIIRYDRRDTGISDPIKDDLTLEAHAADALAVMDAAGSERAVGLGGSDGARSLAALAAMHPERVSRLIAVAPTVSGGATAAPEIVAVVNEALADLEWPRAMMRAWTPNWLDDPVRLERAERYIRTAATPRQTRRLLEMSRRSDLREVLPHVQAPTLVLFPEDAPIPRQSCEEFAALVPDATFALIPGASALFLYALDIDDLAARVEEFVTGTAPARVSSRVLASVLFTDLVASTAHAQRVGDRVWTGLLERHHEAVRSTVAAHGGEVVKTLGDGVLAVFSGPAQAVRCGRRVVADARFDGLDVRSGVHTGEIERTEGDVAGVAVHLAARIMSCAAGGEVLCSRTVKDLVVGSELAFEPRGERALKGFDEPWSVFAAQF
jgi:class 3 adenylate cyclase